MRLECNNLTCTYPGSRKPVFENLSFSMDKPGFNAVFGPSGMGKTSLAKLIATPGSCLGREINFQDIETVLYSYNLERLPGWSGVGTHLERITPPGREGLRKELVSIFEMEELLASRYAKLSMGQQNRMNLIRYLLQDFDLLILDESLANVDEKLRGKIILSIKELFQDKMFLYISHNLAEVSRFCSQIFVFTKSRGRNRGCLVNGLDSRNLDEFGQKALESIMLEIMNAV